MGFFSRLNQVISGEQPKTPTIQTATVKPFEANLQSFNIGFDYTQMQQDLYRGSKGYLYGPDGLFPQELNRLFHQSPLHSSILSFKRLLTTGNGYTTDGTLNGMGVITLNQLTNQFDSMMNEMAMDYFIHSRICLKITWNSDNTKILKVKRISPDKIRIDKLNDEMEAEEYLYNWDWLFPNKYPTIKYHKFDQMDKDHKVQLYVYQVSSPGMKLYAEPSYQSALNWVMLDAEMSQYHKANITNSLNPSMLIQYFEKPGTKEEKQQVLYDLNNSFAGSRKTGRAMVTFSDSKDLAPTVQQLDPNKLDATFLSLTDTIQRQICYSHQLDPQLLGLKTPGSLGNSGDFIYSFNLFNQTIIQPAQRELESIFNTFIAINGIGSKLRFNDVDIEKLNPAAVAQTVAPAKMGQEGIKASKGEELGQEGIKAGIVVNEAIKGLSAKEHQQLLRIIRQYSKGQLLYDAAYVLLKTSFGLSDEDIALMLGDTD